MYKTLFYFEHPERCKEYGLPVIIDGDESNLKMKMYVDEAQTYRNSADEILNIYELLENRFVSLSD